MAKRSSHVWKWLTRRTSWGQSKHAQRLSIVDDLSASTLTSGEHTPPRERPGIQRVAGCFAADMAHLGALSPYEAKLSRALSGARTSSTSRRRCCC